jgi:uncharacterized 2Fe-2S/4Fe-4S cluster protein (DUF4445 family)
MRVTFQPDNLTVEAIHGERLLDIARGAGVGIRADCGGKGKCGTCRVLFRSATTPPGALSEPLEAEESLLPETDGENRHRLACTTRVYGDVEAWIPPESRIHRFSPRKPVTEYRIPVHPSIRKTTFRLDGPGGSGSAQSLRQRVRAALTRELGRELEEPSLAVMAEFSRQSVTGPYDTLTAAIFEEREIIQLRSGADASLYGLALDLGTTSLAAFLCDLRNDRIAAVASLLNPQVSFGEDVISRIAHVRKDVARLTDLQDNLVEGVNHLIRETSSRAGIRQQDILDVVAVGNPTMQHFFLGLNPASIGEAPYLPICFKGGEIPARDLNIEVFPLAKVHLLPMVSGFIGGDTIAALLTRGRDSLEGTTLIVDVGTNGELVLAHKGRLTATSCATGPVFEGAQIRCGMRASPGAIDKAWLDGRDALLQYHVIDGDANFGDAPKPAGICGSGVISIVSVLTQAGVIRRDGAFAQGSGYPGLRTDRHSGQAEIVIVPGAESRTGRDIVFTQSDVRAVQLGKAALRAGIDILMKETGAARLDRLFLAGTFGSYLDPLELLNIGMLPPMDLDRIESIGNAAGDGARMALLSTEKRHDALDFAERIHVVELNMRPDFQEVFIDSMAF